MQSDARERGRLLVKRERPRGLLSPARPPWSHMVRPGGFEPSTLRLEVSCSIQLSYGRMRAGAWMIIAYGRGRDEVGRGSYQTPWWPRQPCHPIRHHICASGFHVSLSLASALILYVTTLGQTNRHPPSRSRFPYHASSKEALQRLTNATPARETLQTTV